MKIWLSMLLCWVMMGTAQAQTSSPVRQLLGPARSSAQLTARLARVVDSAHVAGLSVLVLNRGRIVYEQFFGTKDRRTGEAFGPETVSYAASLTKPVTAYLCLRLVDQGVVALDTPVYRYLKRPITAYEKWQDLAQDPAFARVTIRMLLSHSAGLPILRGFYGPKLETIAEPGTRFFYSNEGYNLLGTVLEERTGLDLQTLAEQELFGPLDMSHTSFVWQPRFAADRAVAHDQAGKVLGFEQRLRARGAGSMVTTPRDYAAFLRQVLARKGLSRQLYRLVFTSQIKVTSPRGWGPGRDSTARQPDPLAKAWGLGWGLFTSRYGPAFWHGGHAEGWQNLCVAYPKKRLAVVLLSNSDNFQAVGAQLLRSCLGDADAPLEWAGYSPAPRPAGSSSTNSRK
ncbi:serine hydrolase domain-containing protein [Hymenobacter cellulosilyticus]|uniref:Beta-lactamase family protein n=1 Tax=Hymenobacter cellulosilyticus TaxID=2932248 RepID=A0A8T9Q3L5_9BACT|nr:serine hydrolase domain-containing protein [Hymenobacter cellulosilyticus]UOQ70390.1 beta-lactamase family protein [Hymenobacter cellulosilyticus]